jgi:hypothetical protein
VCSLFWDTGSGAIIEPKPFLLFSRFLPCRGQDRHVCVAPYWCQTPPWLVLVYFSLCKTSAIGERRSSYYEAFLNTDQHFKSLSSDVIKPNASSPESCLPHTIQPTDSFTTRSSFLRSPPLHSIPRSHIHELGSLLVTSGWYGWRRPSSQAIWPTKLPDVKPYKREHRATNVLPAVRALRATTAADK